MYTLPWSGVSKNVEGVKTAEEAIVEGGLDWRVDIRKLYLAGNLHGIPCLGKQVSNRYGVVRTADNKTLGIVGEGYSPIQNRECFSFFDGIVGQGLAKYKNVGQTDNGSRIFIIAEYLTPMVIRSQKVVKIMHLHTAHDGTSSVAVSNRMYREVCSNGLIAEIQGFRNEVRIRHSANYKDRMIQARKVLGVADAYYKELGKVFSRLADTKIDNIQEFTEKLLPATEDKNGHLQVTRQREKVRMQIDDLYDTGVGNHGETAWDAYNAVAEYVDHRRTIRSSKTRSAEESRYLTSMLGDGARLKQRALDLLTIDA